MSPSFAMTNRIDTTPGYPKPSSDGWHGFPFTNTRLDHHNVSFRQLGVVGTTPLDLSSLCDLVGLIRGVVAKEQMRSTNAIANIASMAHKLWGSYSVQDFPGDPMGEDVFPMVDEHPIAIRVFAPNPKETSTRLWAGVEVEALDQMPLVIAALAHDAQYSIRHGGRQA
jgi:hypothetical protein